MRGKRENGIANYGHSRTGKLNSVHFGPQTAIKIGPVYWTTKSAAITLGIATHLVFIKMISLKLEKGRLTLGSFDDSLRDCCY